MIVNQDIMKVRKYVLKLPKQKKIAMAKDFLKTYPDQPKEEVEEFFKLENGSL